MTTRDATSSRPPASSSSASRRSSTSTRSTRFVQTPQGAGPYPDPDFRQLDSWIVIRQDNTATFYVGKTDLGQGTGTAFRQIMSDELDIAYDEHQLRDGQHRRHGRSGRLGRIGCAADRRLADAPRRRRSAPRAARHGVARASACRSPQLASATASSRSTADPVEAGHLRRADRRQAVQRHADRQQHRRDDRHGDAQDGAGAEDRRPVAAALRHPAEGGRLAEVGGGREGAGHGARAQREAAGGRRHARQHRRVVGDGRARASSRWSARATTSRWCASARSRRFARRGS